MTGFEYFFPHLFTFLPPHLFIHASISTSLFTLYSKSDIIRSTSDIKNKVNHFNWPNWLCGRKPGYPEKTQSDSNSNKCNKQVSGWCDTDSVAVMCSSLELTAELQTWTEVLYVTWNWICLDLKVKFSAWIIALEKILNSLICLELKV